jgi:hypothetical protein
VRSMMALRVLELPLLPALDLDSVCAS